MVVLIINSIHVSFCPILLRNNTQHNSQRVRIHVHGKASKACWGVFTNPLSPHVVALRSRLYTQHTGGGVRNSARLPHALPRELGCRHQPQMRQLTCVSSPSVANYIRAVRGYAIHTRRCCVFAGAHSLFPASEAITGHEDYKKIQHRNFVVAAVWNPTASCRQSNMAHAAQSLPTTANEQLKYNQTVISFWVFITLKDEECP